MLEGMTPIRFTDATRAVALVFSVWNIRPKWIQRYQSQIIFTSKVLTVVLPALFSALRKGFQVNAGFIGTLILMNFLSMCISVAERG